MIRVQIKPDEFHASFSCIGDSKSRRNMNAIAFVMMASGISKAVECCLTESKQNNNFKH